MRAVNIKISKIDTFRVRDVKLVHKINEHSKLKISGAIDQEDCDKVMRLCMSDEQLQVSVLEEDEEQILFIGDVYNVEIEHKGYEDILCLELVSGTINLDMKEKIRTFQNSATKIHDIMNYINKENGANLQTSTDDKKIENMLTQYKETDWEFLKRLASFLSVRLLPDVTQKGICYNLGILKNCKQQDIEIMEYSAQKNFSSMRKKNSNGLDLTESDTSQFKVVSRDMLFLGDKVCIEGQTVYVYEVNASLVSEELVFTYICRREKHFKTPYRPNVKMIGASLEGKVSSVEGTMLEIDLDVDKNNTLCGNRKFAYATVYSSEGGTGWYCMPEEGDKIRLYFPSEREKDAYVISSVHLEVSQGGEQSDYTANSPILSKMPAARTDPSYKSIKNKQNKEIIFSSKSIIITNNLDMSLVLDDDNGIVIDTDAPVLINSNQKIVVNSKDSILLSAENRLLMEQGKESNAYINMENGEINMVGGEFRLQEK